MRENERLFELGAVLHSLVVHRLAVGRQMNVIQLKDLPASKESEEGRVK